MSLRLHFWDVVLRAQPLRFRRGASFRALGRKSVPVRFEGSMMFDVYSGAPPSISDSVQLSCRAKLSCLIILKSVWLLGSGSRSIWAEALSTCTWYPSTSNDCRELFFNFLSQFNPCLVFLFLLFYYVCYYLGFHVHLIWFR